MSGCDAFSDSDIFKMINYFKTKKYSNRNISLVVFGCFTGLRLSEILSLKRRDIINFDKTIKHKVYVKHTKTKVMRTVYLNETLREYLKQWLSEQYKTGRRGSFNYIFTSRTNHYTYTKKHKKKNKDKFRRKCGLSVQRVIQIIQEAAYFCNIEGHIGSHSMRKTAARISYEYAQQNKIDAWTFTKNVLGHKSVKETEYYLSFICADFEKQKQHAFENFEKRIFA